MGSENTVCVLASEVVLVVQEGRRKRWRKVIGGVNSFFRVILSGKGEKYMRLKEKGCLFYQYKEEEETCKGSVL